jgi:hypothetical protein
VQRITEVWSHLQLSKHMSLWSVALFLPFLDHFHLYSWGSKYHLFISISFCNHWKHTLQLAIDAVFQSIKHVGLMLIA